jgi:hypothetical protein
MCNRKGACCCVKYCPLEPSWATTIHKFQGFEAGFDETDQINYLIIDPGNLAWEQKCPGALYVATSRAKTIGTESAENGLPKSQSALCWEGSGMSIKRIMNGAYKMDSKNKSNLVHCELVKKRHNWVKHLEKKMETTPRHTFNSASRREMEQTRFSRTEIIGRIATVLISPTKQWLRLKKSSYSVPKSFYDS